VEFVRFEDKIMARRCGSRLTRAHDSGIIVGVGVGSFAMAMNDVCRPLSDIYLRSYIPNTAGHWQLFENP
jgi:hypothetical protein